MERNMELELSSQSRVNLEMANGRMDNESDGPLITIDLIYIFLSFFCFLFVCSIMFKDSDEYYKEIQDLKISNKNELKNKLLLKLRKNTNLNEYEEKKKKIKQNKIVSDMECPICFGAFLTTTVTICGHSFCEKCYADSIIHKPVILNYYFKGCPICRVKVRTHQYHYCKTVDRLTNDRMKMDGK